MKDQGTNVAHAKSKLDSMGVIFSQQYDARVLSMPFIALKEHGPMVSSLYIGIKAAKSKQVLRREPWSSGYGR